MCFQDMCGAERKLKRKRVLQSIAASLAAAWSFCVLVGVYFFMMN